MQVIEAREQREQPLLDSRIVVAGRRLAEGLGTGTKGPLVDAGERSGEAGRGPVLTRKCREELRPEANESVAFFREMADKYGQCPNLLYEDYNEPTKVTWDRIKKYHETVVAAIRAKDPDNLIILGTPDWSSGVDKAAASPVSGTNLLYTLHFYSCTHDASSRAVGDAAMAKGLALFITEFGAAPSDGGVPPNNRVCEAEANQWWDWMEKNGISGTAWKLVSGVDSSNIFSSSSKPPADGPFPDSVLSQTSGDSPGHGQIVVNWLRK